MLAKYMTWLNRTHPKPGAQTTEGGMVGFLVPNCSIRIKAARNAHDTARKFEVLKNGKGLPPSVVARMKEVTEMKKAPRPKKSKRHRLIVVSSLMVLGEAGSCQCYRARHNTPIGACPITPFSDMVDNRSTEYLDTILILTKAFYYR
jgi:hypothetical protein